jgi:hypothetical protein
VWRKELRLINLGHMEVDIGPVVTCASKDRIHHLIDTGII